MLSIPQAQPWRRFCAVCLTVAIAAGCAGDSPASSQTQRRVGEARLQEGLSVSLTYGAVRASAANELVVRQASPTMRMSVESAAEMFETVDVELRNVHLQAELRVDSVSFLDSESSDGCPVGGASTVDCVAAEGALGQPCETSGQCPEGLRCAMNSCQPSDLYSVCAAPAIRRLAGQPTSISFDIDVQPCRRIQLQTVLPRERGEQPLRFGVIGPSRDDDILLELADSFRDAELDFVVLLGDNAPSADTRGLDALERTLIRLGTPAVVIAGPRELSANRGEAFLRRFGPHDHIWELDGVRFFSFYSAPGALGPRGFERLKTFLLQLNEAVDPADPPGPLIGMTHRPPIDPNALRDAGFRNDVEGARVMSLLQEQGVHHLYAGALGPAEETFLSTHVIVTTAHGTIPDPSREWIFVEVREGEDADVGRVVAGRTFVIERRQIL